MGTKHRQIIHMPAHRLVLLSTEVSSVALSIGICIGISLSVSLTGSETRGIMNDKLRSESHWNRYSLSYLIFLADIILHTRSREDQ